MTVDNMAKMLSIYSRIESRLPVIIMGETGCGKTSLIRQMCALIKAPMRTLNIHGGMDDAQIVAWMWAQHKEFVQNRVEQNSGHFIVFLDEVNTCNSMALFKEIVCDRTLEGTALPDGFVVLAACNPYVLFAWYPRGHAHARTHTPTQPAGQYALQSTERQTATTDNECVRDGAIARPGTGAGWPPPTPPSTCRRAWSSSRAAPAALAARAVPVATVPAWARWRRST